MTNVYRDSRHIYITNTADPKNPDDYYFELQDCVEGDDSRVFVFVPTLNPTAVEWSLGHAVSVIGRNPSGIVHWGVAVDSRSVRYVAFKELTSKEFVLYVSPLEVGALIGNDDVSFGDFDAIRKNPGAYAKEHGMIKLDVQEIRSNLGLIQF